MSEKLKLDIVSDVACPWCYVGKKNLELALKKMEDLDIDVNWKPFQLDPTIPETGLERNTYLVNKFGSLEKVEGMMERLREFGREVGITFNDLKRIPNTQKMHSLMHEARQKGRANELKEAFFKAYFEEALDMTDEAVILGIATKFGWTKEEAIAIMNSEEIAYEVNMEIRNVQNRGVSAVPFFILNDQYGVAGAQPPEVLENWIRKTKEELETK